MKPMRINDAIDWHSVGESLNGDKSHIWETFECFLDLHKVKPYNKRGHMHAAVCPHDRGERSPLQLCIKDVDHDSLNNRCDQLNAKQ